MRRGQLEKNPGWEPTAQILIFQPFRTLGSEPLPVPALGTRDLRLLWEFLMEKWGFLGAEAGAPLLLFSQLVFVGIPSLQDAELEVWDPG